MIRWTMAGILSLLFNLPFFFVVNRFMGSTSDPYEIATQFLITQALSFTFSVVLVLFLKTQARKPT